MRSQSQHKTDEEESAVSPPSPWIAPTCFFWLDVQAARETLMIHSVSRKRTQIPNDQFLQRLLRALQHPALSRGSILLVATDTPRVPQMPLAAMSRDALFSGDVGR